LRITLFSELSRNDRSGNNQPNRMN
jgi:hypothetical protein